MSAGGGLRRAVCRALVVVALGLGAACGSLLGYEDAYTVAPPDASGGSQNGEDASGGAGGSGGSGGSGGQGGVPPCADAMCVPGYDPLDPACDPCVADVCAEHPSCCSGSWTPYCVDLAVKRCGLACCGDGFCVGNTCAGCPKDCGECACPHSACEVGTALDAETCMQPCDEVCMQMDTCCFEYGWTDDCSLLAAALCPPNDCITQVCTARPGCCETDGWTQDCVDDAKAKCATGCDCARDPCEVGDADPLTAACDPCVAAVCFVDSICCTGTWDELCVSYVPTVCGIAC
jgi:hypothetical protein